MPERTPNMSRRSRRGSSIRVLIAAAALTPFAQAQTHEPQGPVPRVDWIGAASIDGGARDLSGLTGTTGGVPNDRLGSFGSAMDYLGRDDLYIGASDRGPNDGMSQWRCRLQILRVRVAVDKNPAVEMNLERTILLSDEQGNALVGARVDIDEKHPGLSRRYDPEGIRVSPTGTVFISEEYGPAIDEFQIDGPNAGRRVRRLPVPERFTIAHPFGDPDRERDENKRRGRAPNRGFEGLAISWDRTALLAILQSPLLQDGAADKGAKAVNVRVLRLGLDPAAGGSEDPKYAEFIYPLESESYGISEILAFDASRYLVLERDGEAGSLAEFRRLFLVDTSGPSNVSHIEPLPARGVPPRKHALAKRTILDFMDPRWKLAGPDMPEKLEGLCWGPDLPDGRRLLLVAADNDLKLANPNRIWAFAVARDEPATPVPAGGSR